LMILFAPVYAQEAATAFHQMMRSMEKVKTCTFVLDIRERIFGKMLTDEYIVKLNARPYKVYVYSILPNPGAQALYVEGSNNNRVLISPNRFPYIKMNFNPQNMLLRKDHQYSIKQMGFNYIYNLLNGYVKKDSVSFFKSLILLKDVVYKGNVYDILEVNNPAFAYVNYKVLPGETVTSIAEKLLVNDHMLLEINPGISDYDDVKAGQVIKVPNSFAKKIVFYIDRRHGLPLIQVIYDDKGLYGWVEMSSFVWNPELKKEEFSRHYPKYSF
jgi:LysM repeat protein